MHILQRTKMSAIGQRDVICMLLMTESISMNIQLDLATLIHVNFVNTKNATLPLIAHMDIYAYLEFATNIVKSWGQNRRIMCAKMALAGKTFAMERKLIVLRRQNHCAKARQIAMDSCGMVNGARRTKA